MNTSSCSLIARSPAMKAVLDTLPMLAAMPVPLLITGESGAGKSLLAREIAQLAGCAEQPFVELNCAALSTSRAAEQLFGEYVDGEFRPGYMQAAEGGILFLDEVAELPLAVQGALLRFLERGEIQPVGDSSICQANVRVLAASNADMLEQLRLGKLREDFYYRLSVVPVHMPSLRERREDIAELLKVFSDAQSLVLDKAPVRFSAAAMRLLKAYSWPGNVRELENLCVRLMALLPEAQVVEPGNLPEEIRDEHKRGRMGAMDLVAKEVGMIQQALTDAQGNKSKAARLLGISRDTLNYRLKKYQLV